MELRRVWFPILLALVWMVVCAAALTDFANFSAATRAPARVAQKERVIKAGAQGRRPAGRAPARACVNAGEC